ncbi:NAD kinase [Portunus trituberculatus]|uniref:NAD kinase n=1 Tax=Portunus trituberculatus TaxID=210409 RepID=A0A5B7DG67_PORTR|nr:NAD kinase [Portunus trituberculatus]
MVRILRVTTSIYPVPSICAEDQIADWFASLDECLRWNDRKRQKHFDEPEDPVDLTPDLTHSSSSDTLDSLSERNEVQEAPLPHTQIASISGSHTLGHSSPITSTVPKVKATA